MSKEKEIDPKLIRGIIEKVKKGTEVGKLTIKTLDEELRDGDLKVDYTYQREFLYDDSLTVPSKMVESVLLGLIIPEIQIFIDDETQVKEIIDGQQRVLSLVKFYRGEYALRGLTLLNELNGYRYQDLPANIKRLYKDYSIPACIIGDGDDHKFEVFYRLNKGSKALNPQEVRNCVYRGEVVTKAKEVAELELTSTVFSGIKNERHSRTEFILRLWAIVFFGGKQVGKKISNNINLFLNEVSANPLSSEGLKLLESRTIKTLKYMANELGIKDQVSKKLKKRNLESIFIICFEGMEIGFSNPTLLKGELLNFVEENEAYLDTLSESDESYINRGLNILRKEFLKQ